MNRQLSPWFRGSLVTPGSLVCLAAWCLGFGALAYPPTPHHQFYGMVRDEMGNPLNVTNATVILEALTGTQAKTTLVPSLGPGKNYRLNVAMDAGSTADNYKTNVLRAKIQFRMKVKIGPVTYLPIETAVKLGTLGQPAQSTRMDLTLGEDADGDGLPDAWERALLAMLGRDGTINDIRPEEDSDGDGLSNYNEYIAGTYAFDPDDGFRLEIRGFNQGRPVVEFLAIPGRRYALQVTDDLAHWSPVQFRLPEDAEGAALRSDYSATAVRLLRLELVVPEGGASALRCFKALVQ